MGFGCSGLLAGQGTLSLTADLRSLRLGACGTGRHGMDRPGHESDKGAVIAMTGMPVPDFSPREGPGQTSRRFLLQASAFPLPTSKAGPRRRRSACGRHGAVAAPPPWLELGSRCQLHGFLLAYGACANAQSQVTWFLCGVGMKLILVVAVVSVPAVFGGTACRCWKSGHLRPGFVPDEL
jgi:hypothetical protein